MVAASFRGIACPPPPTREELTSIQTGTPSAAEPLLHRWEPIILASAESRTRCPASCDDVAQAGRLALLNAAKAFDPSRGPSFNNYASRALRNETIKAIRRLRSHRSGECPLKLAAKNPAPISSNDTSDRVRDWLCTLPRVLIRVFVVLYRWDLTQRDAALRLDLSQPRICQLHQTLLVRGRRELAGLMIRNPLSV